MNTYTYTREKLYLALNYLATGRGDVRARLCGAYRIFEPLTDRDFPIEFQRDWNWIKAQLTKKGPMHGANGEVQVSASENTLSQIRNSTGQKIAQKIFDICWDLHTNKKYL